jgi:endonuclease G, mitochondrial
MLRKLVHRHQRHEGPGGPGPRGYMERGKRVAAERRKLCLQARNRWSAVPRVPSDTLDRQRQFEERQRLREAFDSSAHRGERKLFERMIGATLDFADLPPNEQALKAGRPVVRLVLLGGPGIVPQGFATGFLVAPDLLITNHHVFRTPDEARGVGAQFLYERTREGIREGLLFDLEPERFFINDRALDYAVVAVASTSREGAPLSQFHYLPLIAATGKILKGDPVSIIQHPDARPKQYATVNNRLLDLRGDGFLLYETDTLEGSSGSPVFNGQWETVALHHCGVPETREGRLVTRSGDLVPMDAEVDDSDLVWIANEGIRVSALVASFAAQRPERPEQRAILQDLLAKTVDPLRLVVEKSPLITGTWKTLSPDADEGGMAPNVFHFSGPVTIQVRGANGSIPRSVAASVPSGTRRLLDAATAAPEFREKSLRFDEDYGSRDSRGYDPDFLGSGWSIPAPSTSSDHHGVVLRREGKPWVIPYYHYSVAMNETRRLLAWAASNVDYSAAARRFTRARKEYGGENWRLDPRVAVTLPGLQLEDAAFYAPAKKIDRGHIVRREDSAWGSTAKEAEFANSDTYHWTNCTPQSEAFNQSGKGGLWGQFEEHIEAEIQSDSGRMCVFAGPVLNPEDPEHGYEDGATIQVPMEYWKVVACVGQEDGARVRRAYGFVFDQTEAIERLGFERVNMDDYAIYQVPLAQITRKTGVVFDASLVAADVLRNGGAPESIRGSRARRIEALEGIVLR